MFGSNYNISMFLLAAEGIYIRRSVGQILKVLCHI